MKKPFTQLENETMEALARAPLTAREFRVILAIIRLTNGFHLTETKVSLNYLIQLTGLARNHLQATVKRLGQWQVVVVDEDGLIACHGPALWCLPHSPDLGLSGRQTGTIPHSPGLGLPGRQTGTIPHSPDLGLSQIVPGPDRNPDTLKKNKEGTLKKGTLKKGPASPEGDAGTGVPACFQDWMKRLPEGGNPVPVLVDAFKTTHPQAPPEDRGNLGPRLAGMLRQRPGDQGYILKLIWDTASVPIAGSHLSYIQGCLKAKRGAQGQSGGGFEEDAKRSTKWRKEV